MIIKAVVDTNILLLGPTTTIISTDNEMLEYFCTHAGKKDYTFNTPPISVFEKTLKTDEAQISEKKLIPSGVYHDAEFLFTHKKCEIPNLIN